MHRATAYQGKCTRCPAEHMRARVPSCAQPPGEHFGQDAASFLDHSLPKDSAMLPDTASAGGSRPALAAARLCNRTACEHVARAWHRIRGPFPSPPRLPGSRIAVLPCLGLAMCRVTT